MLFLYVISAIVFIGMFSPLFNRDLNKRKIRRQNLTKPAITKGSPNTQAQNGSPDPEKSPLNQIEMNEKEHQPASISDEQAKTYHNETSNDKPNSDKGCVIPIMDADVDGNSTPPLNAETLDTSNKSTAVSTSKPSKRRRFKTKRLYPKKNVVEDSMGMVFVMIILIFLICHFPRILLDAYEIASVEWTEYCEAHDKLALSFWSLILVSISHVLLVLSSSVNMIIYCVLGTKFRIEARKSYEKFCKVFCFWKSRANNNIIV